VFYRIFAFKKLALAEINAANNVSDSCIPDHIRLLVYISNDAKQRSPFYNYFSRTTWLSWC